jgi:hypothetical protein
MYIITISIYTEQAQQFSCRRIITQRNMKALLCLLGIDYDSNSFYVESFTATCFGSCIRSHHEADKVPKKITE